MQISDCRLNATELPDKLCHLAIKIAYAVANSIRKIVFENRFFDKILVKCFYDVCNKYPWRKI